MHKIGLLMLKAYKLFFFIILEIMCLVFAPDGYFYSRGSNGSLAQNTKSNYRLLLAAVAIEQQGLLIRLF